MVIHPPDQLNQQYKTFCRTFQYIPGVTAISIRLLFRYAMGPDESLIAVSGWHSNSVSVTSNNVGGGDHIPTVGNNDGNRRVSDNQTITITSMESLEFAEPEVLQSGRQLLSGGCRHSQPIHHS